MTTGHRAALTLPAQDEIRIVRDFDVPRELLYRAYTDPELVRRWWHAGRGEMTECTIDLRPGGRYRFAMRTHDGGYEVAFSGEFREVVPDRRFVASEVYEGAPGGNPTVNEVEFADNDYGGTTLTVRMLCGSKRNRDTILETDMEDGLQDALSLLEDVARS